ncbi:helix-turn-helix domain-containing protein [Allocoprobacillus halotolerans]|uniref:Helix-turn-helix domain-containing protein n=1 Tax=Allocoprobacillus halotolerans TaxID=2944914 RepID=A0ABY5I2C7_9FIRM|nr:helix-turn-helix transcriptional regulator [Allocoprobacillus halotolerans]UTY39518.1 helix-turn-helix domain-containing protein [Allocoprobacillus halotolerans]
MDFADKIKFLREKILGMSQTELAKKLSVSRISIYNWENGISKPSVENIKTISLLCGITTDYLIKENTPLEISLYNIDDQAYKILKDLINYLRERNSKKNNEK